MPWTETAVVSSLQPRPDAQRDGPPVGRQKAKPGPGSVLHSDSTGTTLARRAAELPPAVCVSLHDVAPATWPACERLIRALHEVAPVPLTLLVVPHYHRHDNGDAGYRTTLDRRLSLGDELALHGYFHLDEGPRPRPWRDWLRRRWYTAGEGEFSALDENTAWLRLEAGLRWFARRDWPVAGFIAPAWLLSPGSWRALAALPFRYTTSLRHFYLLDDSAPAKNAPQALPSQSLVYSVRGGWRRRVSRHWNEVLYRRLANQPLLRLSLHPADAAYPEVIRHWQALLTRALHDGREAMTKHEWAARLAAV